MRVSAGRGSILWSMRLPYSRQRRPRSVGGIIGTLLLVLALYLAQRYGLVTPGGPGTRGAASPSASSSNAGVVSRGSLDDGGIPGLYLAKTSNEWVEVTAVVDRILPDDTTGDEHQKFLIRVEPELRVLVAHNTDAAQRVPVKEGDQVRIRGEYEYTDKGGTLHFTHKPKFQRKQPGGWIEFEGVRYE